MPRVHRADARAVSTPSTPVRGDAGEDGGAEGTMQKGLASVVRIQVAYAGAIHRWVRGISLFDIITLSLSDCTVAVSSGTVVPCEARGMLGRGRRCHGSGRV